MSGRISVRRVLAFAFGEREDLARVAAMMGLFFLVVCTVGILRPIKNSLALDGLGDTEFYQVYFVSAAVVLFVPPYNHLADRISWPKLIPAVALFFALNLVLFRLVYREGSGVFGMVFYGWYDLFAAALVTQFFMATQLLFDARESKRVYPVVIAGGSLGATLGGAITGFFAETVGTPNLLLVAAALIAGFAAGLPFVWPPTRPVPVRAGVSLEAEIPRRFHEIRAIGANRQVRLIALSVLVMVLVKQLVDYEFNTLSERVFVTRDAISAFQGKFNAATQWLPIVGVLALRPVLRRWGVGAAILLLPALLLGANIALAVTWSLWAAVAAKTADTSLRYSAERASREILYVPVPEAIRLKAKAYIDVAVEKGVGKVASGLLIMLLLAIFGRRWIPFVAMFLAAAWLVLTVSIRREYVHALALSIRGRFAGVRGLFAGVTDASTLPLVREALASADPLQAAFALDLIDQLAAGESRRFTRELHRLLEHPSEAIRERALSVLQRQPDRLDEAVVRRALGDESPAVRLAAVRALYASAGDRRGCVTGLLGSSDPRVRTAVLAGIACGAIAREDAAGAEAAYLAQRRAGAAGADPEARIELALAAGTLEGGDTALPAIQPFVDDPDPRVASAAIRALGLLGRPELLPRLIHALGNRATRDAAREALVQQGGGAVGALTAHLLDRGCDVRIRRNIPSVMARIPTQATVDALLVSFLAPETDQLLDFRSLKVLGKLRSRHLELVFDRHLVEAAVRREVDAALRYDAARQALGGACPGSVSAIAADEPHPVRRVLDCALAEAWRERREGVFRCLGLLYPPLEIRSAYFAATTGTGRTRANALEWLEHTIGYAMYRVIAPLLPEETVAPAASWPVADVLAELSGDGDEWVACCARVAAATATGDCDMELLEKVFLLQRIDLLRDARSAHVALLASIAEEVSFEAGAVLLRQGEPTDAAYTVISGAVQLRGIGDEWILARAGDSIGSWTMIDAAPSVVGAIATEPARLLRISRADFYELLEDNPELALGLLQGLARRVRALVA